MKRTPLTLRQRAERALARRYGEALSYTHKQSEAGRCLCQDDETGAYILYYAHGRFGRLRVVGEKEPHL